MEVESRWRPVPVSPPPYVSWLNCVGDNKEKGKQMRKEWREGETLSGVLPVWTRFCRGECGFATRSGSDDGGQSASRVMTVAAATAAATTIAVKAVDRPSFVIPRGRHFRRMGGPLPRGQPEEAGKYIPETGAR